MPLLHSYVVAFDDRLHRRVRRAHGAEHLIPQLADGAECLGREPRAGLDGVVVDSAATEGLEEFLAYCCQVMGRLRDF